jgi:tRNA(fMet)-specific endonuclease VapC
MLRLAFDTNAYTALGRGNELLGSLVSGANQIGLPITVLGEIHFGILNGAQKEQNTTLLDQFLSSSRVEVLEIDDMTVKLYGEIATQLRRMGRSIQQNDIWIAALSKQYDYRLATNDAGFENILGLEIAKF